MEAAQPTSPLGSGTGINECPPGEGRWEGSQDTKICGAQGVRCDWSAGGHAGRLGVGEISQSRFSGLFCAKLSGATSLEKPPGEVKEKIGGQVGWIYPLVVGKVGWGV